MNKQVNKIKIDGGTGRRPRVPSLTIIRREENTGPVAAVAQTAAALSMPGAARGLEPRRVGDRGEELRYEGRGGGGRTGEWAGGWRG